MATEPRRFTLSPSQMDAFGCRLAWDWQYRQGYQLIRRNVALTLGSAIHHALEQYYANQVNPVEAFVEYAADLIKTNKSDPRFDDEIEEFQDAFALGKVMLEGYLKRYPKEPFKVLSTEQTILRRLHNPLLPGEQIDCWISVRLDAIVQEKSTGDIFALEHKTFERFNPGQLDRDHQLTAEVWAGSGVVKAAVSGVIWNGLRKQAPGKNVKNQLFERHTVYRTDAQVKTFLERAYYLYEEMTRVPLHIYPSPNNVRCGQCSYKEPCTAWQNKDDYRFILENMYTKREEVKNEDNEA
jgi:PD-(D/E)XK nuclease superfamily